MVSTLKNPDLEILCAIIAKKHMKFLDERVRFLKKEKCFTVNRSVVLRSILDKVMNNEKEKGEQNKDF